MGDHGFGDGRHLGSDPRDGGIWHGEDDDVDANRGPSEIIAVSQTWFDVDAPAVSKSSSHGSARLPGSYDSDAK